LRPNELRVVMEAEARRLRAQYTATGNPAEPSVIAALVLEACQALPHVTGRMELLWRYVEDYVRGLEEVFGGRWGAAVGGGPPPPTPLEDA
jgi:hypothetical protein